MTVRQIADEALIPEQRFALEIWHEFLKRRRLGVQWDPDLGWIAESTKGLQTWQLRKYVLDVARLAREHPGVQVSL